MYGLSVFRFAKTSSVRHYKNGSTKKLLEFLAEMPKVNTTRITEAQQQRQNISKKGEKYGPSTVYLQVLGSGARGVPNTLYLFTDQKRYLFNCGECTQRLAHEHKVKLSRLEHVFITSKTWRNIGGLPGLSLTLQDVGVPKIILHGPDGLDELYNATKRFVIMKEMQVSMAPSSPTEDYDDSVMTVKYVHLSPQTSLLHDPPPKPCKRARLGEPGSPVYEHFTHDNTDYYGREPEPDTGKKRNERARQSKSPERKKSPIAPIDANAKSSVAYICTLKKRLGTLDLAKCVERGVPPGPLLGQLKSGLDVVLADGTIVLSKDVKTPDDPGPVFIVLELPDISYLNEAEFAAHFDNGTNSPENIPTLVVHMSPPEVFHHQSYKAFMSKFGDTTRHLILNSQNLCLGSEAVHRTQHKLHLLDPEVFPLLKDPSLPAEWSTHPPIPKTSSPTKIKGFEDLKNRIAMAQFQNIINSQGSPKDAPQEDGGAKLETYSSRTLTMFHLRPKRQIDRSAEPKLHIQDYYQETMDVDGFVASLEKFRGVVHDVRYAKNTSTKEYPKVVFLGTGSCIPSKTRNTSAIIVHVDDQSTILLDCGEGTFGQLVRFYGPRKVDELLRTLKAIYISHLHADHHIGLIGVLQARAAAFADAPEKNIPLYLLAPGQIATWLTMYDRQFERILSEFTLVPNQSLMAESKEFGLTPAAMAYIGLDAVQTCPVPHCPNAFGVAVTAAGHKITYSGDTLPTDRLVAIGDNSAILIHEATMEDELADEARVKMHSTTSQAIEIGRKMNAKYTILTHFSQRYARLPRLNAHILNDNKTVGIAFDNMQVTLSDLPLLPHMYAPLQLMFAEHCVDMELKAASRERRREGEDSGRRSARCQSTDSRSSSRTRSLSRKDSSGKRNETRKGRKRVRRRSRSSSVARSLTRSSKDDNPTDTTKTAHKPNIKRRSSAMAKESVNSKISKGHMMGDNNRRLAPRYRETLTSRLRREHVGNSSTNLNGLHKSSTFAACKRIPSPYTAPSSRCMTPRTPSPAPPVTKIQEDENSCVQYTPIQSEPTQDFFSDDSSAQSCAILTRKSTRTVTYDTRRVENKQESPKLSRSSICKTYIMVNSREGYGQPLLKLRDKKLIIRKYPIPSFSAFGTDFALTENDPKTTSPSSSSKGNGGPSVMRVVSGVGATKNGGAGARSPPRSTTDATKPPHYRVSHIPVLQKPVPSLNGSIRSYKPQLEDIESSYFMLRKKQAAESNIRSEGNSVIERTPQQMSESKKRIRDALVKARISFLRRSQMSSEESISEHSLMFYKLCQSESKGPGRRLTTAEDKWHYIKQR